MINQRKEVKFVALANLNDLEITVLLLTNCLMDQIQHTKFYLCHKPYRFSVLFLHPFCCFFDFFLSPTKTTALHIQLVSCQSTVKQTTPQWATSESLLGSARNSGTQRHFGVIWTTNNVMLLTKLSCAQKISEVIIRHF